MSARVLALRKYKNGVEYAHDGDEDSLITAVLRYRVIMHKKLGCYDKPLPLSYILAPNGAILIFFYDEFPENELPLNGGLSEFTIDGFQYRFETEGVGILETLSFASHQHTAHECKENLCYDQYCHNYCGALDVDLFMPAGSTFFVRYTPKTPDDPVQIKGVNISEPISVMDADGKKSLSEFNRAVPLTKDEYMLDVSTPTNMLEAKGEVQIDGAQFEIMPAPSEASQLDMHLAQLSSIDDRYVLRFTNEVKHMFDENHRKPFDLSLSITEDEEISEDEDSDNDDSYVQSALVPGLRQCDFSHVADMNILLGQLKADDTTQQRMAAILQKSDAS